MPCCSGLQERDWKPATIFGRSPGKRIRSQLTSFRKSKTIPESSQPHKFNPFNGSSQDDPTTNLRRSHIGRVALQAFCNYTKEDEDDHNREENCTDLITNLFHYMDSMEIDVEKVLRMARSHWEEER